MKFSLITHLLVKICPAFRIQNVKLIYHIGLSIQQETKKQRQNNCYEKGTGLTLAVSWEDSEFIPEGLILKLMLAGETFNSFLLDGFSNLFYLFLGFLWIQIDQWKPVKHIEYKVCTELIKETRTKILLWERKRLHFGCWLELHIVFSFFLW